MRASALVLACLVCVGHARRMRAVSEEEQGKSQALAKLLAAFGPAAAFAPSSAAAPKTTGRTAARASAPLLHKPLESVGEMSAAIPFLKRPPKLDGTMAGDLGFDPMLVSDKFNLEFLREAELKHARVCMLATLGWVAVDLGFRVPFAPAVTSLYAHDAAVEAGPMISMLIPIALVEVLAGIPKVFQILFDPNASPGGYYAFDPLGFGGGVTGDLAEKELANGRLAMLAFSGIVTQAPITGGEFPYTYNGVADLVPPIAGGTMPGFGS
mmetsp:Transcript_112134/g.205796  ORF Transcript_112134/g.205796 Transcript_112134/m.205796 type:complete len:268 (-) Transcript_112134:101-904(-)